MESLGPLDAANAATAAAKPDVPVVDQHHHQDELRESADLAIRLHAWEARDTNWYRIESTLNRIRQLIVELIQ